MSSKNPQQKLIPLLLTTIGVVYGDIGTSPLYALKQAFVGYANLEVNQANIYGLLSLLFWTMTILISIKYVGIMLLADNRGEGGSLALVARVTGYVRKRKSLLKITSLLGFFAAALFFGDSMITPAISVLSAIEGLKIVAPRFENYIIPVTIVVLTLLFFAQSKGSGKIGMTFGPIIVLWFATLGVLGITGIIRHPEIVSALNPMYLFVFFRDQFTLAFLSLGAVILAATGGEALFTDMGHFGKRPIRISWFGFVMPALLLNYLGQGALLLDNPEAISNPFYLLAPEWAKLPLLILATMATVIASQAVISGAFSVTRQAIQMGLLPRLRIHQTSDKAKGQIYIPFINWMLFAGVIGLVLLFKSSEALASAYGIAVTAVMTIDTILVSFLFFFAWRIWKPLVFLTVAILLIVDLSFFAANLPKIPHGGWCPLAVALAVLAVLTTWKHGRSVLLAELEKRSIPLETIVDNISKKINRAKGTAIFMTSLSNGIPSAFLHNIKHNQVLHQYNIFLTVIVEDQPYVPVKERTSITEISEGYYRILMHYGFMDVPNVPKDLKKITHDKIETNMMQCSFFLSRETIIPMTVKRNLIFLWREQFFSFLLRNTVTVTDYFRIPANRVVEIGTQIEV